MIPLYEAAATKVIRTRAPEGPLSGRQGAHPNCAGRAREEHPVDTIALVRKLAEEPHDELLV